MESPSELFTSFKSPPMEKIHSTVSTKANKGKLPKSSPAKNQRLLGGGERIKSAAGLSPMGSRIPLALNISNRTSSYNEIALPRRRRMVFTPQSSSSLSPANNIMSSISISMKSNSGKPPKTPAKGSKSTPEIPLSKLVTIIRMGPKPRKIFRILLSSKTGYTLEHFMSTVTDKMQSNWGAVRKIYGLNGAEITSLQGFFDLENVFIACPNDKLTFEDRKLSMDELIEVQRYIKNPLKPKCSPVTSPSLATLNTTFTKKQNSIKRGVPLPLKVQKKQEKSGTFGKTFKKELNAYTEAVEAEINENLQSVLESGNKNNETVDKTHPKFILVPDYPDMILSKFHVGVIVGDGNFAVVRECTRRINDEPYALKVIDKAKSGKAGCEIDLEVKILRKAQHPNIIRFFEKFDFPESNEYYMVMELIKGGDLYYAIKDAIKFSEDCSKIMVRDVASALFFLHSKRIVHRDVKPENLLVYIDEMNRMRLKLTDFGLATFVDVGPLFVVCGTPTYIAPEIIMDIGYGTKVDIWALGVISYILLCGYPPFASDSDSMDDLYVIIKTAEVQYFANEWATISIFAKDIINKMMEKDASKRYSARDVLEHPWLIEAMNTGGSNRDFNYNKMQHVGLNNAPYLFDDLTIPMTNY